MLPFLTSFSFPSSFSPSSLFFDVFVFTCCLLLARGRIEKKLNEVKKNLKRTFFGTVSYVFLFPFDEGLLKRRKEEAVHSNTMWGGIIVNRMEN